MAKRATKQPTRKIGLEMKAALYEDLSVLAKDNGQTRSFILEKAVEHYIQFVAPAQGTVRPEIMAHVRRSVEKNRKLLQLLAQ
ncbi:MAG: hypothetical protein ACYDD2_13035 [Candidatus Acidiferrales bacterium]